MQTMNRPHTLRARREFLRFLAASPLIAGGAKYAFGQDRPATAADVLEVMDLEPLARAAMWDGHWGYLSTGVAGDLTLHTNIEAFRHYQLRARRLVNVATADLSTEVFGQAWDSPIYLSAVGAQGAFHADGELAVARAAKAKNTVQMLSNMTTYSLEDVAGQLGKAPWFQLYMPRSWDETERMVRRVEAAGCTMMAWTIDLLAGRNTVTGNRLIKYDQTDCLACHSSRPGDPATRTEAVASKPMYRGMSGQTNPPEADWNYVGRLKKMTSMKLLIKGIDTPEDARLARENGADGVVVSNHGGRALETGRATIDILPEVVDAVPRDFPVFMDGGVRRGGDVYKALALGARGVGIGRGYIWGLAAFGQAGVERVLEILNAELALTMRQAGTPSIPQITRAAILRNGERL